MNRESSLLVKPSIDSHVGKLLVKFPSTFDNQTYPASQKNESILSLSIPLADGDKDLSICIHTFFSHALLISLSLPGFGEYQCAPST